MCTFYRGTIESILTSCITVWYGACNASCRKSLQRIVRAAEKIIGVSLPSLQDIYSTCLTRKALCIAGDPTHPPDTQLLQTAAIRESWRRLQARTSRLKDSFIHQAVRKLNSLPTLLPPPHPPHTHTHTHTPAPVTLYSIGLTSFNYLFWQSEKTALFVTLNRIDLIRSFALHHYILHCFFISLVCTLSTMCLMPSTSAPICSVRSLLRAPTRGGGGHHPSCSKKKKKWSVIPATARASCLWLNADDHNWWTTMPVKRHQQSGAEKKKKKKMKTKPARHFQVGYIHNQRSIKIIFFCVVIKTDLSQQQPLKWLKNALYKNNEATLLKKQ